MLHAYMLTQSGIPMLYSSDEIGRLNDYSYKEDPDKAADSRYIHRGAFQWELAEKETPNPPLRDRSSRLLAAWSRSAARNLFLIRTVMYIHTMFMMTAFSASSARKETNVSSESSISVTAKNCLDAGGRNLPRSDH